MVLLVVCLNVAGLFVARTLRRRLGDRDPCGARRPPRPARAAVRCRAHAAVHRRRGREPGCRRRSDARPACADAADHPEDQAKWQIDLPILAVTAGLSALIATLAAVVPAVSASPAFARRRPAARPRRSRIPDRPEPAGTGDRSVRDDARARARRGARAAQLLERTARSTPASAGTTSSRWPSMPRGRD